MPELNLVSRTNFQVMIFSEVTISIFAKTALNETTHYNFLMAVYTERHHSIKWIKFLDLFSLSRFYIRCIFLSIFSLTVMIASLRNCVDFANSVYSGSI